MTAQTLETIKYDKSGRITNIRYCPDCYQPRVVEKKSFSFTCGKTDRTFKVNELLTLEELIQQVAAEADRRGFADAYRMVERAYGGLSDVNFKDYLAEQVVYLKSKGLIEEPDPDNY